MREKEKNTFLWIQDSAFKIGHQVNIEIFREKD